MRKPMLAQDYAEGKLRFPLIAQPKIDGVRGLNGDGTLTGRSLKKHANKYTTAFYSHEVFTGLDGELAAEHECHPDLCRLTTSALNTISGEPYTLWHVFDYITEQTVELPYAQRLNVLAAHVASLNCPNLRLMRSVLVPDLPSLLSLDDQWLDLGYEGTIIRDPQGKHKAGRSTVREGGLLRIKRFMDAEGIVVGIEEGQVNNNAAQQNELGLQYRTTHQENMVPSGLVGNMQVQVLKDVADNKDNILLKQGQIITVSPGKMPHTERKYFFDNQGALMGQIIKFKFFPKGQKDKPRFPTFQGFRMESDL